MNLYLVVLVLLPLKIGLNLNQNTLFECLWFMLREQFPFKVAFSVKYQVQMALQRRKLDLRERNKAGCYYIKQITVLKDQTVFRTTSF